MSMNKTSNNKKKDNQVMKDDIIYTLNVKKKTADVVKSKNFRSRLLIIPQSISHESQKYTITSISSKAFKSSWITTVQFEKDSKPHTIEKEAFSESGVESVSFPASVVEF